MHDKLTPPSDWVVRFAGLLKPKAAVLDLACGPGRHTQYLSRLGHVVTAVDVSSEALQQVRAHSPQARTVQADLENGTWPFSGERFDAIVVTNYLWRTLFPDLLASMAQDGLMIYETFAVGNERFGKPSRQDFLLQSGELLKVCSDLQVIAYEAVQLSHPDRVVQRICARASVAD